MAAYRLFISEDRTILLRIWPGGQVEFARREDPDAVWGPPVRLFEEVLTER